MSAGSAATKGMGVEEPSSSSSSSRSTFTRGGSHTTKNSVIDIQLPPRLESLTDVSSSTVASSGRGGRNLQQEYQDSNNNVDEFVVVDDDDEQQNIFDVYESPCTTHASNEEFSATDIDNFSACEETAFYGGCLYDSIDELQQRERVVVSPSTMTLTTEVVSPPFHTLDVTFDYELYYRVSANATRAMALVSGTMLEHVASVTGLTKDNGCTTDDSSGDSRLVEANQDEQENRRSRLFTNEELDRFVAVSNLQTDYFDPDFSECFVPVPRAISENNLCKPVTSTIRAYLKLKSSHDVNDPAPQNEDNGGELSKFRTGILRLIRHGMNNNLYVSGNVQQTVFIGTRTNSNDTSTTFQGGNKAIAVHEKSLKDGSNNLSGGAIAAIICIIVSLAIFIALFLVDARKKKKQQELNWATSNRTKEQQEAPPDCNVQQAVEAHPDQNLLNEKVGKSGSTTQLDDDEYETPSLPDRDSLALVIQSITMPATTSTTKLTHPASPQNVKGKTTAVGGNTNPFPPSSPQPPVSELSFDTGLDIYE